MRRQIRPVLLVEMSQVQTSDSGRRLPGERAQLSAKLAMVGPTGWRLEVRDVVQMLRSGEGWSGERATSVANRTIRSGQS